MSVAAKAGFLTQLEGQLGTEIPAAQMARVLALVSETLEGFDMQETADFDLAGDDLLDIYVSALKVMGRTQKTIDRYVYIINKMTETVGVPSRKITVYHLRAYLAKKKEEGLSEQSLKGEQGVFSAYFNWLQRENLIERNPTANLGSIKVPKKQKKIYTEVDLEKLVQGCKCIRDRAIISFLDATGCRISEMTGLNRDAIDLDGLKCVVHGKGNKDRTVYFDEVTAMRLREYLDSRTDDNEALFLSYRHQRIHPCGVRTMMNKLAAKVGVDHVHPHKFRRTTATNLTRRGMAIQDVAKILGHEKLDTTMKYVVLNDDDTRSAYRRYR